MVIPEEIKKLCPTKNVLDAYFFASENHKGQFRKSGEPYINHCIEVFNILKSWGVRDENLLISALLHDVIEDCAIKSSTINKRFGNNVAFLVESVTKFKLEKKDVSDLNTLRKLLKGTYLDQRVSILKLADRLHNLRTLEFLPKEKQIRKARESLEVYAKLAESLGLWIVKTEIEDLSFKYLNYEKFAQVKKAIDSDKRLSKNEKALICKRISKALPKAKVNIITSGYFHAYQKLKISSLKGITSHGSFKNLNDIISYRVIVNTEEDCYKSIYKLHNEFEHLIDYERYDEFIGSNKRLNGYQALQTTVNTTHGAIEIAVVTASMESFNNYGYLDTLLKNNGSQYKLKLVFTPEKDLMFLPQKAKAIDFAYYLSTGLGDTAVGAIINGKQGALTTNLSNTDVVRIITGERQTNSDKMLMKVCLPETKLLIERKIIGDEKIKVITNGKLLLEEILIKRGILDLRDIDTDVNKIVHELGCENVENIYYKAAKGYLNIFKFEAILDDIGLIKDKLKWTTIEITGNDKPGLLKIVTDNIAKYGGNIVKITFNRGKKGEQFYLRVVAENIKSSSEQKLKQKLSAVPHFKNLRVV